jgi:hypothetical protein
VYVNVAGTGTVTYTDAVTAKQASTMRAKRFFPTKCATLRMQLKLPLSMTPATAPTYIYNRVRVGRVLCPEGPGLLYNLRTKVVVMDDDEEDDDFGSDLDDDYCPLPWYRPIWTTQHPNTCNGSTMIYSGNRSGYSDWVQW